MRIVCIFIRFIESKYNNIMPVCMYMPMICRRKNAEGEKVEEMIKCII